MTPKSSSSSSSSSTMTPKSSSSSSSSSTRTRRRPHLSYFPKGNPACPCINVEEIMVAPATASSGSDDPTRMLEGEIPPPLACVGDAGSIIVDGPDCWPDNFGSDQCLNWNLSLDDVKSTVCFEEGCDPISPPPRDCFEVWCYVDPLNCDILDEHHRPTGLRALPSTQYPDSGLFYSTTTCGNDYKD
ncbi:hypothetical protein TeGR_g1685 [Tetraparma gracilis]|uniref:Uncharacterized protein n=1 Tax=Tetraparma gracilis TaxID=2962635 RepID=A0ABQ6M3G9_9STRA|nr:hypothetical protein TeGR_g1685 [Tetraparma gracilis]